MDINTQLQWHWQTVITVLKTVPFWVYLLPGLAMPVLYMMDQTAISPYLTKHYAEIFSPLVLAVALLLSVIALVKNQQMFYRWVGFFALILFLRELHFVGTNNGFYIGFLILMWWASKYRETLQNDLFSKKILSLTVLLIWVYLITKTFDRHLWDSYMPANTNPDLFEENLELLGHLLFLGLTTVALIRSRKN